MRLALVVLVGVAAAPPVTAQTGSGGRNRAEALTRPHVVLVSFDGFRPDYLARFATPHFDRLAARGARATGLVGVFPSLTFPAHYSIATGMHPEAHGIVGNRFYDPERRAEFSYRIPETVRDGTWWRGEPIWVTAEQQGLVTAALFFPGTEAAIGGVRPTFWRPYDGRTPNDDRIRQVLTWLARPAVSRPHLVTLYFSLVDSAGHRLGPDHVDMRQSVETADRLLGTLMDGLDARSDADRIVLVVVSDHGMAPVDPDGVVALPAPLLGQGVRIVDAGPAVRLYLAERGRAPALRDRLNAVLGAARAYLRHEVPAPLRHRQNARIGDIVVIPDGTGVVLLQPDRPPPAGTHGWDPRMPAMHGIFLAAGPGIRPGTVLGPVASVDVYPLLARLLGLTPHAAVAGTLASLAPALVDY